VLNWIGALSESEVVASGAGLVSFAISIWALVELGFLRGTPGPNQYGPDPLTPEPIPAVR
jgi:uncharacterized membrane protein YhaH (DUF805 family)